MLKITDRYILREVLPPFGLALLVLTFLLMLPPIMDYAEDLIAKGVNGVTILRIMATLIPQGLGITIPMALLIGVLMGLGRMSTDRETVALQACGVSIYRMLAPLALLAVGAAAATCYIMVVALPDANQAFREITFRTVANQAEGEVKSRVFYDAFPNRMLYVREVSATGHGWSDVFLANTSNPDRPDVFVAERGRVVIDREQRLVDIVLLNGTQHVSDATDPTAYEEHRFKELTISLDAESVFPRAGPQRGLAEFTVPQLRAEATRLGQLGLSSHRPIMEIHRKFSIPVACLVFTLIGLGLGVTSRKDGKLASFVLGIGVIFTYYVVMYTGEAMAKGALVSPHLAMWLPNIVLGVVGLGLILWRSHSVERRVAIPLLSRRYRPTAGEATTVERDNSPAPLMTVPRGGLGNLTLLDWYVAKLYLRWVMVSFIGLLGIFYISTFIDLSDKLFKGQTSGTMLLEYFWNATPQFMYFVLPISALVAALITIGLITKSSELTVMKACGISLYRTALPIFALSLAWSACLFVLGESVLARSNRRAEALRHQIRTGSTEAFDVLNRRWAVSSDGAIYHYLYFDPDTTELSNLSVYEFEGRPWRLNRRTFAAHAIFADEWNGRDVWVRDFPATASGPAVPYAFAASQPLPFVEPPTFFQTERPDAELMTFAELERYIDELAARGFDVVDLAVDLHRKASFPFVTFILTLIAVPFAVTTGPRGALYGVGVGIALAFSYWVILSIFAAIGSAGLLGPALAAWAPNVLFGGSAAYLLLRVRT